jgi:hypothetical protein
MMSYKPDDPCGGVVVARPSFRAAHKHRYYLPVTVTLNSRDVLLPDPWGEIYVPEPDSRVATSLG